MTTDQDKAAMNAAWEKRLGGTGWPAAIEFANGFAAALEYARQPAEPVAKVDANDDGQWADILPNVDVQVGQLLYATPQPAPLVRLTEREIQDVCVNWALSKTPSSLRHLAHAIMDAMQAKAKPAPVTVDHSGLIRRIDAAIERVTKGYGLMTIPADPRSDVDLVLSECKALLEGKEPPFWAADFHKAQPASDVLQILDRLAGELVCLDWAVAAQDPWEQIELRVKDMRKIVQAALAKHGVKHEH